MFKHFNIPLRLMVNLLQYPKNAIQHIKARDFTVPGDISSASLLWQL